MEPPNLSQVTSGLISTSIWQGQLHPCLFQRPLRALYPPFDKPDYGSKIVWDTEFVLFDPNTEAGHSLLHPRQRIKWSRNKSGHHTTGGAANAERRGGVDEAATAAAATIRRRGGIINSNPCHPTFASNLQLNVLLARRSFPTSDLMRKNWCRCRIHFVHAMIPTRSFRPIDVGYFDGSIDDLSAAYRYAALTMLMEKTMTKWKRTAMATTMTTMMRAFVGL